MHFNMNKYISNYKRKRSEEVNELVSYYKQQRSFAKNQSSSSSNLCSLNPLSLTPWEYNLDQNIIIKTEKDLAIDSRDFEFNIESEPQDYSLSPKEYCHWYSMENIKTGDRNSVCFASMMTDVSSYEEQYLSLKIFLAACNTAYKRELSPLLFPVFLHFYLDLIMKPELSAAQAFFTKFHHDHEENYKEKTTTLQKISTTKQLPLYPSIKEIREYKTAIKLSQQAYLYLVQHLRHGNYTLILQTLNQHFSIKTSDISTKFFEEETPFSDYEDLGKSLSDCTVAERQAISNLEVSIGNFKRSSKLLKPSICVYSFLNAYLGIPCASFARNNNILAAGLEDSSVRYWNIVAKSKSDFSSGVPEERGDTSHPGKESGILRGHTGSVYQVEFLYDDQFIISASQDKSVRLWDLNSTKCLVEYRGHNYSVWDVCSSPRGHYFASSSLDRTIRLWNIEYAFPLRIFAGHNESVDRVSFHPNGNYIASGSADKSCRLWDIQSGQFVRVFVGHKSPVRALSFTKDGKYLLSAGEDKNIMVWDLSNGQLLNEVGGHTKTIYNLTFSSDGTMFASGGLDRTINVWESETVLKKSGNSLLQRRHSAIGSYPASLNSILTLKFSWGNLLLTAGVADNR